MIKENNLPLLSYIDERKSSALYKWYDRFESKDRILEFSQSITTVIKNILEELSKTNIWALLIDINTRNILVWNNIRCFKPVIEDITLGELSKENILAILLLLTQRIVSCDMNWDNAIPLAERGGEYIRCINILNDDKNGAVIDVGCHWNFRQSVNLWSVCWI